MSDKPSREFMGGAVFAAIHEWASAVFVDHNDEQLAERLAVVERLINEQRSAIRVEAMRECAAIADSEEWAASGEEFHAEDEVAKHAFGASVETAKMIAKGIREKIAKEQSQP